MPITVEGLPAMLRALSVYDQSLANDITDSLAEAARIIADDATGRLDNSPKTAAGIRPRSTARGRVVVEETRRRTTGKRPDWGVHVMQRALIPALDENADEVMRKVDDLLDRLGASFNAL